MMLFDVLLTSDASGRVSPCTRRRPAQVDGEANEAAAGAAGRGPGRDSRRTWGAETCGFAAQVAREGHRSAGERDAAYFAECECKFTRARKCSKLSKFCNADVIKKRKG